MLYKISSIFKRGSIKVIQKPPSWLQLVQLRSNNMQFSRTLASPCVNNLNNSYIGCKLL